MSDGRNRRLATIPGVKQDAVQILEKFLQSKVAAQNKRAELVGAPGYQAVTQVVIENDSQRNYFRSDSYRQASVDSILCDSADGPEEAQFQPEDFRTKTASLPSSYRSRISREPSTSKKDSISSPSKKTEHKPQSPKKHLTKAGSISSSDTETEGSVKRGRKKKSLFTRTKERLRHAFRKQSNNVDKNISKKQPKDKASSKKPNKAKKKAKSRAAKEKAAGSKHGDDVVAVVHTHTSTHIHQEVLHPNGNSNQPIIIRTEETVEDVEMEDEVQMRHTKKRLSVKESENGFGGSGLIGRIRKSFSRRRSAKDSISASKSEEPMKYNLLSPPKGKGFKRTNSEPAAEALSCCSDQYSMNQRKSFSGRDKKGVTEFFSELLRRGTRESSLSDDMYDTLESPINKSAELEDTEPGSPVISAGKHTGDGIHGDLQLKGLIKNRPNVPLPQESFDLDYECEQTDKIIRTASGNFIRTSTIAQGQNFLLPSTVDVDGKDCPDNPGSGSDVPFEDRSEQEKDQMYDVIARKLADIADDYAESEVESPKELTSLEKQLLDCLRNKGDQINSDMNLAGSPALQMVKNATYGAFQSTMQNAIGHETSVKQIALLFHLTKRAVEVAGAGGALAMQIKENTLRYFEDKFAAWIVGQGGWDSMLEDTDSEFDKLD